MPTPAMGLRMSQRLLQKLMLLDCWSLLHSSAFCTTFQAIADGWGWHILPPPSSDREGTEASAGAWNMYLSESISCMSMALPSILWGVNIHGPGPNTNKAGRRTTSISSHSHMDCPDIGKGVGELSSPYTAMFKHVWSAGKGCPKKPSEWSWNVLNLYWNIVPSGPRCFLWVTRGVLYDSWTYMLGHDQIWCSIPLWTPLLLKINLKQPEKSSAGAKWLLQATHQCQCQNQGPLKTDSCWMPNCACPTRPGIPALETSLPETCWIHVVVQQKGMPVACREMLRDDWMRSWFLLDLSAMSPFSLCSKGTWINDSSIYWYILYILYSNYPSPAFSTSVSLSFGLKWMNSQVMFVEWEDLISRLRINGLRWDSTSLWKTSMSEVQIRNLQILGCSHVL